MKILFFILILYLSVVAKEDYIFENTIPEYTHPYLHFFIAGVSSYIVNCTIAELFPKNKLWQNIVVGSSVGISLGLAKEIFDYSKGYNISSKDLTYNLAGVILFEGIYIVVYF